MDKITGEIKVPAQGIKNIVELKKAIDESAGLNVTNLLEIIFGGTVEMDSSDLHIEPEEEKAKVRLRVDGLLQDVTTIEKTLYEPLLSRIKLLGGMKMNISDRPQDGRFSIAYSPKEGSASLIEIRVSILPAEQGESIVLRVLNPKNLIELEALGLRKDLLELFKKELRKPNGMIIVTGPTGSGKTTTLYAFLKKIQQPEIKIITIEDPIEYHLAGISQTQVKKEGGYDFASGLKSIMRQDPDVILVGEVRDLETVKTALQAALTGHLVLTTLHTNDAAGTIPRLISLGAEPSNIGPAVNIAVAQRLVRKVCPKCSKLRKPTVEEIKIIKAELKKDPKDLLVPEVKGCKYCNLTGYKGRVGIFEVLVIDDEIEKLISVSPTIAALREKAVERGMTTMRYDGLLKVLGGVTTFEEVDRVAGEE
jgi:type II secretory ATPase GspE/PulE/Tfp pilus assembly ATPase PilB-like protein